MHFFPKQTKIIIVPDSKLNIIPGQYNHFDHLSHGLLANSTVPNILVALCTQFNFFP